MLTEANQPKYVSGWSGSILDSLALGPNMENQEHDGGWRGVIVEHSTMDVYAQLGERSTSCKQTLSPC